MGLDPLSMIGLAIGAANMAMGVVSAGSQAKAAAAAAQREFDQKNREMTIQQQQADEDARREKGDRAREADRELASLRVAAGETGGLGTVTSGRLSGEAAYFEGLDLARIESNRSRTVSALQRQKEYTGQNAAAEAKAASSRARASAISAIASGVGSGLQIYGKAQERNAQLERARGKTG